MEDKERRIVSFQVSADEVEAIESAAANLGVSRSEYLRSRVLSPAGADADNNTEALLRHLERLLRHLVYITSRTHVAVCAIPETAGTISTKQLREMYDGARTASLEYMADLPERMAKAETDIASQSRTDTPQEAA
jgi:alpha-L-fucosidase